MKKIFILKFLFYKVTVFLICSLFLMVAAQESFASLFKQESAEEYRLKGFESQRDGNVYEALKNYSKAVALGLSSPEVYNDIGVMFEKNKIVDKAESAYLKSIEIDSDYLPPYNNLGYLYKSTGQDELALQYFCKRFSKGPLNDQWGAKVEEEILEFDPNKQSWIDQVKADKFNRAMTERKNFRGNMLTYEVPYLYERGIYFYSEADYETAYLAFKLAATREPENKKFALAAIDAQEKLPVQSQYYFSEVVFPDRNALSQTSDGSRLDVWMAQPTIWQNEVKNKNR